MDNNIITIEDLKNLWAYPYTEENLTNMANFVADLIKNKNITLIKDMIYLSCDKVDKYFFRLLKILAF